MRALPKGLIEEGEPTAVTAAREVLEETGLVAEPVARLGDVRYVYTLHGERIFKIVIFHLMRWRGGRLGDIEPEMRRRGVRYRMDPARRAAAPDAQERARRCPDGARTCEAKGL